MKAATVNNIDHNYSNKKYSNGKNDTVDDSPTSTTAGDNKRTGSDSTYPIDKAISAMDLESGNERSSLTAIDYSSIRGKNVLVSPSEDQFDLLQKRLEERTRDNRGETIYEIGVGEGKIK